MEIALVVQYLKGNHADTMIKETASHLSKGDEFMADQKIVPHFWYDDEAVEAAEFYTNVFPDSRIISQTTLQDTPSGDAEEAAFELMG